MEIEKISSTLKSPFSFHDINNKSLNLGDIIAVSGNKCLRTGIIHDISSLKIKYCFLEDLENNKFNSHSCISQDETLNISKLYSDADRKKYFKLIDTIQKAKKEAKKIEPHWVLFFCYNNDKDIAIIASQTIGTSLKSYKETKDKLLADKRYSYIFPYGKNGEFLFTSKIDEIKFFSARNGILETYNGYFQKSFPGTYSVTGTYITVKRNKENSNHFNFYADSNIHESLTKTGTRWFIEEYPIKDTAGQRFIFSYDPTNQGWNNLGFLNSHTTLTYPPLKKALTEILCKLNS